MLVQSGRPLGWELFIALVCLVIAVGGAFLASAQTQNMPLFSLSPPCGSDPACNRTPFMEAQRLDLHRSVFTAWAALILVTPALCAFLFRRSSAAAARHWLNFWTVSFVAFAIHFYWSSFVLYGGDWGRIFDVAENGGRVTVPKTGVLFVIWWGVDVLLGWLVAEENRWIRLQRVILHLLAFILFFAGSALLGERVEAKALGFAMGLAVLIAFIMWLMRWRAQSKSGVAAVS